MHGDKGWCSPSHQAKQPTIWHRSEESITIQIYLYRTWKVVLLSLLVSINTHNRSICTFYLRHFLFHGSFHVCFLEEAQLHFSFVIALKSGWLRMYSTFLPIQVNFPVTSTISLQQQYSEHSPDFDRHNFHTSTYNRKK
jgi:hypothetical protein